MSKLIPLSKGKFAIVDDEDYTFLNRMRWQVHEVKGCFSAIRRTKVTEGKANRLNTTLRMESLLIEGKQGYGVTHKNHDTLDYRKNNLTLTTKGHSISYGRKRIGTVSKHKGVTYHIHQKGSKPWSAQIHKDYKRYGLGYFHTEDEAAIAYNRKAQELYGTLAYQNEVS